MKTPRDLSGRDLVKALCQFWDYKEVGQRVAIFTCKQKCRDLSASPFLLTKSFGWAP